MGRAAQAGRGLASAAKPRRAAALAGVGREGRLADAPSFMVKARYHGSTGLRHVLPASCANGVTHISHINPAGLAAISNGTTRCSRIAEHSGDHEC